MIYVFNDCAKFQTVQLAFLSLPRLGLFDKFEPFALM